MTAKAVNNDMDMLSVSRIKNLPDGTTPDQAVNKSQLDLVHQGYLHTQMIPSSNWVIVHNLGVYPSVTVLDSAGTLIIGDVVFDSLNQVTLNFASGFSGTATLR